MSTIEAVVKIHVTQQDIDDIMATALEGGICYWCREVEVVGKYLGIYASEQISRGGQLKLYDYDDDGPYALSKSMVLGGLKQYIEEGACGNQLVYEGAIEAANIDADIADCIIQYALFGKLVYA
ncbi:MAG: hypothetical protein IJ741_03520 [Schwartzia sp.]|nr:hypothetical protein [Schwartzia sp. (in: firmicutes)]